MKYTVSCDYIRFYKLMSMKTMQNWFDEYAESHQHPTNKTIHWICLPLIYFSIVCFLANLRVSTGFPVSIILALVILFYIRLSWVIAIGMMVFTLVCMMLAITIGMNVDFSLWQLALTVFVLAWIGQFIGHKIEGKKPSFLKDIQFLLIGLAWLLGKLYKKWGIEI